MTANASNATQLARELATAMPSLSTEDQRLVITLYRLLSEGQPVASERLAEAIDRPADQVSSLLDEVPGIFFNDGGEIVGFWGISLPEMPHRLTVDGRTLYAWCAWDALFLPELIGRDAMVESKCPTTGQTVSLRVGGEGVKEVSPSGAVLSFLKPDGPFDENVISSFCHFIHFFASEEAGREWTAEHESTFLLSIEDGFELGRLTNRGRFGAALGHAGRA